MRALMTLMPVAPFRATHLTSGAWNIQEQHIAPAMGLLAHLVERDRDHRRPDVSLLPARLSYDILGTLPVDTCETEVRVLRPGRTVELVEATLSHDGRAALVLRAWLLATRDTTALAGHSLAPIPTPQDRAVAASGPAPTPTCWAVSRCRHSPAWLDSSTSPTG